MQLDSSWTRALSGADFSPGQEFRITGNDSSVPRRLDVATELVRGKRVIHVGCVDHVPILDEKIAAGTWLHQRLHDAAARCVGVDIDTAGIDALKARGWTDVFAGDVTQPESFADLDGEWDMLFLGEIVEHVDNPVAFLSAIRETWKDRCSTVVLTLPNAYGWSTLRAVGRSIENINTDHRYWFTPYTAAKVATQAGYEVVEITMCEGFSPPTGGLPHRRLKRFVLDRVLRRNALIRSSIVIELRLGDSPGVPVGG